MIKNTPCIFWLKEGCHNIMHTGKCAMDTGIDPELYEQQVHGMLISELTTASLWCADIKDLIVRKQFCPITLEEVNRLDKITLDRIKEIQGDELLTKVYG